jgi:hypothetical protein
MAGGGGSDVAPPDSGGGTLGGNDVGGAAGTSVSSAGMGGDVLPVGGNPPTPCTTDDDCSSGWRCRKEGCDATTGSCEPPILFCPPDAKPTCGCDGVTYWNDCTLRQAGATMAFPDECHDTASPCDMGADCKVPNASCNHLLGPNEMCGHVKGACWVLPQQCTDSHLWQECTPPGSPPGPCVDTCQAILSEKSYTPPHRGTTCN